MNDTTAALAVLLGLVMRLAIPVLITALVVFALRKLDSRWRAEGSDRPLKVAKPQCWKTKHCPPAARKACTGYKSPLPCWQAFRSSSGYLADKCLACPVLIATPLPARA
jgi:hypothetical protein